MEKKRNLELSPAQRKQIDELTESEIENIDSGLMKLCTTKFQKVAKIVGMYMADVQNSSDMLPDAYFASRIFALVESQKLDFQGNLGDMRNCEVRVLKP